MSAFLDRPTAKEIGHCLSFSRGLDTDHLSYLPIITNFTQGASSRS